MRRSIETWKGCDPKAMSQMSPAAIYFAIDDARADLLEADLRAKVNAEDCNDAERKLAAAERQVGELREQLAAVYADKLTLIKQLAQEYDTAMGLLRENDNWVRVLRTQFGYSQTAELSARTDTFLNTASTEGK